MKTSTREFVAETQKICEEYEQSLIRLRERLQEIKPEYCHNHPLVNILDPVINYVSNNSRSKNGNSNLSN